MTQAQNQRKVPEKGAYLFTVTLRNVTEDQVTDMRVVLTRAAKKAGFNLQLGLIHPVDQLFKPESTLEGVK